MIRHSLVLLLGLAVWWPTLIVPHGRAAEAALPAYETFPEWREACRSLPANRVLAGRLPPLSSLPLRTFGQLSGVLDQYFTLCRTGVLAHPNLWVGGIPAKDQFFNTEKCYFVEPVIPFQPFAEKLVLAPGSEIIFRGDLHGDIHSLNAMLKFLHRGNYLSGFTVSRPNTHLVFLGDYTDRGVYGMEVIYTLMRLKLANPDRVHLVRGNHEDVSLTTRYGCLAEGVGKYGRSFDDRKFLRLFDFLPAAIYVGCETNFIQCCHGGMEPGFSPAELIAAPGATRFQLLGQLHQRAFFLAHSNRFELFGSASRTIAQQKFQDFTPTSPTKPSVLGFMWNDFTQVAGQPQFESDPGRAYDYGDALTRLILDQAVTKPYALRAVFRAHQHSSVLNPMMNRLIASRGVYRHWQTTDASAWLDTPAANLREHLEQVAERPIPDGSVWTFNVAPDSAYGLGCGFDFDALGILKVSGKFKDWRLRVINVPSQP